MILLKQPQLLENLDLQVPANGLISQGNDWLIIFINLYIKFDIADKQENEYDFKLMHIHFFFFSSESIKFK